MSKKTTIIVAQEEGEAQVVAYDEQGSVLAKLLIVVVDNGGDRGEK